jgi:phage terminase large subunit-like protein
VRPLRLEWIDGEIDAVARVGLPGFDPWREAGDDYRFDVEKARDVIEWIPGHIRHAKGELVGEPFYLADWEAAFAANLFGWVRADDERVRRFRECLLYIPKKNGKSAFAAALMAYELFCNAPVNSQLFVAASVISQAVKNVWSHFSGQIAMSEELSDELKFYGGESPNHSKSAVHNRKGTQLLCIAANESTADGDEPYFGVIDELHRFHTAEQVTLSFCRRFGKRRSTPIRPTSPCGKRRILRSGRPLSFRISSVSTRPTRLRGS